MISYKKWNNARDAKRWPPQAKYENDGIVGDIFGEQNVSYCFFQPQTLRLSLILASLLQVNQNLNKLNSSL